MDSFRIKVFRVLASNLNLSRAGQDLGLSRQSVTQHVKALEEELGTSLFVRKGREILLTAGGQTLLSYAQRIESLCDVAQNAVARASGTSERHLALGASKTIGQYLLPNLIANFYGKTPCVSISAISGNTDSVLEALEGRRIQLALIERPAEHDEIHVETFMHDKMVFAVPANHEWAGREVDAAMLKGVPFLMREVGSGSRRAVENALARAGLAKHDLNVVMEFDSTEGLLSAVGAGLGVTVISRWAVRNQLPLSGFRLAKVRGIQFSSRFFIAHRANSIPSGEAAAFRAFLLSEARILSGCNLYALSRKHIERTNDNVMPLGMSVEYD